MMERSFQLDLKDKIRVIEDFPQKGISSVSYTHLDVYKRQSLVIGNPGQVMRNVTNSEIKTIEDNAMDYIQLSKEFNRKNSP